MRRVTGISTMSVLVTAVVVSGESSGRITTVDSLRVVRDGRRLIIEAKGKAPRTGWHNGQLVMLALSQGELAYEFVGTAAAAPTPVLGGDPGPPPLTFPIPTDISAETTYEGPRPRRIVIHAARNTRGLPVPVTGRVAENTGKLLITISGKLILNGLCARIEADGPIGPSSYSVTGNFVEFKPGDYVRVSGTTISFPECGNSVVDVTSIVRAIKH
jgi:hypothetical protein